MGGVRDIHRSMERIQNIPKYMNPNDTILQRIMNDLYIYFRDASSYFVSLFRSAVFHQDFHLEVQRIRSCKHYRKSRCICEEL